MDARLRMSATGNAGEFAVELWNQGFPEAGAPVLASGTFALGSLDTGAPSRQDILDAVREQTNPNPTLFRDAGKHLFGLLQHVNVHEKWLALLQQN